VSPHSADVEGSGDSRGSELGNVVTSVAFSHEGQYLAFGLSNGTIYIRDVVTDEAVLGTNRPHKLGFLIVILERRQATHFGLSGLHSAYLGGT